MILILIKKFTTCLCPQCGMCGKLGLCAMEYPMWSAPLSTPSFVWIAGDGNQFQADSCNISNSPAPGGKNKHCNAYSSSNRGHAVDAKGHATCNLNASLNFCHFSECGNLRPEALERAAKMKCQTNEGTMGADHPPTRAGEKDMPQMGQTIRFTQVCLSLVLFLPFPLQ